MSNYPTHQEDSEKNELVSKLIDSGSLYYNPTQFKLVYRHTTNVLVTEQDCLPKYRDNFRKMVNIALKYNGDMRDNTVLTMMDEIQPESKGKLYQILGLYLYLADEVSRMPNPDKKTFLQAGRETYEEMIQAKTVKTLTLDEKKQWFQDTLSKLSLLQHAHIKELVSDWTEDGLFKVAGEANYQQNSDNGVTRSGTYIKLAEQLCEPKERFAQIRNCISRALGVKELYLGKSIDEALQITKDHLDQALGNVKRNLKISNVPFVSKVENPFKNNSSLQIYNDINKYFIRKGKQVRRDDLVQKVYDQFPDAKDHITEQGKEFYQNVLSYFPLSALKIIDLEKYRFAFSENNTLREIFPKDDPPGYEKIRTEESRGSNGVRLPRFNLALFSMGTRKMTYENAAQTAIHETLHIAFNSEIVRNNTELFGIKSNTGKVVTHGTILNLYKEAEELYSNLSPEAKAALSKIHSNAFEEELLEGSKLPFTIKEQNGKQVKVIETSLEKILNSADSPSKMESRGSITFRVSEFSEKMGAYNNYLKGVANSYATGEEICANIFGLMYTEFSKDKNIPNNPFHEPCDEMFKPIQELAKKINDTMKIVQQELEKAALMKELSSKGKNTVLSK